MTPERRHAPWHENLTDLLHRRSAWLAGLILALALCSPAALAANAAPGYDTPVPGEPAPAGYTANEIIRAGHELFGSVSGGLAGLVERAIRNYGLPNGYIIGEEASGALIGGLRYGEGVLYTKNVGHYKIFWQGPSVGWDVGADGNRTMMLVYDMPTVDAIYRRFGGIDGSAYFVGGLGMTVLTRRGSGRPIYVVPIRTGVGARLGLNVGYLKFTPRPTWNPF